MRPWSPVKGPFPPWACEPAERGRGALQRELLFTGDQRALATLLDGNVKGWGCLSGEEGTPAAAPG